jgi:hypothetical protein
MVYLGGKVIYLGRFNSAESKEPYRRVMSEWAKPTNQSQASQTPDTTPIVAPPVLTIAKVVVQFKAHAERYYKDSREGDNLREAL